MAYVYLLKSLSKGTYYIGSTIDIDRRLSEHISGKSKYTKTVLPIKLVGYKTIDSINEARWIERSLKKNTWKRKQFIAELEDSSLSESIDS